ncbi:MAG TPA: hypothetical protein VFG59_01330 [Anaeromyxobacter sp.]|nr:hypothetical protein [Anaeromyxobacter sp.]
MRNPVVLAPVLALVALGCTGHAGGACLGPGCSLPDGGSSAGNPDGRCLAGVPAEAIPEDTSQPTTVVGTGSAASCTEAALSTAVARGGVITFDCGSQPVRIRLTATLELPTDRHTVLDGGDKVTLDGGGAVRILEWNSGNWQVNENVLTLQHLTLADGKATGTELIPTRPAPCSQGYDDGEGGALRMRDGVLHAIDVTFTGNQAALLGPDTGGGAVYLLGTKPATFSRCSFLENRASNAGAVGGLFATLRIYDSLFDGNEATGYGANDDDQSQCPYLNNGQYQVGSGGNGGAIYSDGVGMDVTICGTQVRNSHAGAFGAAVFFTSNDPGNLGTLSIRDSLIFHNVQDDDWWEWKPGISTNANTLDPVDSTIEP